MWVISGVLSKPSGILWKHISLFHCRGFHWHPNPKTGHDPNLGKLAGNSMHIACVGRACIFILYFCELKWIAYQPQHSSWLNTLANSGESSVAGLVDEAFQFNTWDKHCTTWMLCAFVSASVMSGCTSPIVQFRQFRLGYSVDSVVAAQSVASCH